MAYVDIIKQSNVKSNFLAVIEPRTRLVQADFTLVSGVIYKTTFDRGPVYSVSLNGVQDILATDETLSDGDWYYKYETKELYKRQTISASDYYTITYGLFFSSFGVNWHEVPDDDSTNEFYFEPNIIAVPSVRTDLTEVLFGFVQLTTNELVLANNGTFEEIIGDSSFNKCKVSVYHAVGNDLDVNNVKAIYRGVMGDFTYEGNRIAFKTFQEFSLFDGIIGDSATIDDADFFYFNPGQTTFDVSFANIDPQAIGTPIPRMFGGFVYGVSPINIDYNSSSPTTSNNRRYALPYRSYGVDSADPAQDTAATVTAGANTATRTYVSNAYKFITGDSVYFDRAVGTDENVNLTNVDYVNGYVEHLALTGGAMASGDLLRRGSVGLVRIFQDGVTYTPQYLRDYRQDKPLIGTWFPNFYFINNFEATLGMPRPLGPGDTVVCTVHRSASGLNVSAPVEGVILELMTFAGVDSNDINTTSFNNVNPDIEWVGFLSPFGRGESQLTYREAITNCLKSSLLRLYLNDDLKWEISQIGTASFNSATDKELKDDEIREESIVLDVSYTDTYSDFDIRYGMGETPTDLSLIEKGMRYDSIIFQNPNALFLHNVRNKLTYETYLFYSPHAQILADRLSAIFGERRGTYTVTTPLRFFDSSIDDRVRITRQALPGFSVVEGVENSQDTVVVGISKQSDNVILTLDDQKGIEDNAGDF